MKGLYLNNNVNKASTNQLTAEIQQQVQATTQIGANDGMGRKRSLQERNKSYIEQPM